MRIHTMGVSEMPKTQSVDGPSDRRSNLVLRALIDEMLSRVRELARNAHAWTSAERDRAEVELEGVMARVRRLASRQNS